MKKLALILGFLILLAGIPVAVFVVQRGSELRSKAAPTSVLSLSPATVTKKVGESFTVNVAIDAGSNESGVPNLVVSADISLSFDPQVLEADTDSLKAGSFLPNAVEVRKTVNKSTGKIFYSIYTPEKANAKSGSGTIATITFKALKQSTGATLVRFDPEDTVISGVDDSLNILDKDHIVNGSYTINTTGGGGTNPTPTRTPTQAAGGTPTRTPTQGSGSVAPTVTVAVTPTPGTGGSTMTVTFPLTGSVVTTSAPTISGTATSGSTITVVIVGTDSQTGVVLASSTGSWSYSPTTALVDGAYSLNVTEQTLAGSTSTTSTSFTVQTGALPETGAVETTLFMIAAGLLLLGAGAGLLVRPL